MTKEEKEQFLRICKDQEKIRSKLKMVNNLLLINSLVTATKKKKKHECTDADCQHDASKRMKQYD